ncbi:MAG: acetoin utilization protein AcuC, partial [candidate division WOR-3 bacterium]
GLWQSGHGAAHPLKPERLQRTYELLTAYGAFDGPQSVLVPPRQATTEELGLFHTEEYIEAVRSLSQGKTEFNPRRYNFGPGDNPVWPGMYETEALKVGSTLVAAELVTSRQVDVAFSFSGGMHHAGPAFASGFCVFNDAAIAIHWLRQRGLRVAYIDIDAHHGDGVQNAFYDQDQVLTISLHETGLYLFPGSGFVEEIGKSAGHGYAVNLPFAPYTDDEIYIWAFEEIVPPLVRRFQPDIVVSQLGVDTHYRDPLTHLCLTTAAYTAAVTAIKQLAPRWLALGGGGYDIDVVARSWTLAYGIMSGQEFPDELPSAYAEKYGGGSLRDPEKPHISAGLRARARDYAEDGVAALKRMLAV